MYYFNILAMKKTLLTLFLVLSLLSNLYAQTPYYTGVPVIASQEKEEEWKEPWNVYVGLAFGPVTKTVFNTDNTGKLEMPYSAFGLDVTLDKNLTVIQDRIDLLYGFSFTYLHGALKQTAKGFADQYQTLSRWYDKPDKGMNQFTALATLEANTYFNTRFHFSIPFGLGITYANACDKGMLAPCFSACIRPSYFVLDQLAIYAAYKWIISPKIRYDKTALSNCSLFEAGIVYTLVN